MENENITKLIALIATLIDTLEDFGCENANEYREMVEEIVHEIRK